VFQKNFVTLLEPEVGREDIFKPTIGNQNLHVITNANGIRVINCAI
jgi:hypothetical protein